MSAAAAQKGDGQATCSAVYQLQPRVRGVPDSPSGSQNPSPPAPAADGAAGNSSRGPVADGGPSILSGTTNPFGHTGGETSEFEVLQVVGRYRIECALGRGGFGTVYRAWDSLLERRVAVKVLHARHKVQSGTTPAFLSEARLAARVRHPGVVIVHDSGIEADGLCFVVFELIAGETLAALLERRSLSRENGIRLLAEIAEALHVAHKEGLVHRDLKPANILVDAGGQPHITDFGLAIDEKTQRILAQDVSGTPRYMAPEQVRGEAHRLDGRTDIWALGVMVYELLVGRRPFSGRDSRELFDEIQNREPKPPRQIVDDIPRDLERIALTCLSKDVGHRYLTAADVAEELRAWLGTLPPPADSQSSAVSVPVRTPPASMRPVGIAAGTVLAVAIVAGGWNWWRGDREQRSGRGLSGTSPVESGGGGPVAPLPQAFAEIPVRNVQQHKWYPLLTSSSYERPVWPLRDGNSELIAQPERAQLRIDAADWALVELGRPEFRSVRMQVEIYQNPWRGHVGLFWNLRTRADAAGTHQEFDALEITNDDLPDQPPQNWSLRRLHVVRTTAVGAPLPLLVVEGGPHQTIRHPGLESHVVDLQIIDGVVSSVRWDAELLDPLIDGKSVDRASTSGYSGGIGILSSGGSAVFRDGKIKLGD